MSDEDFIFEVVAALAAAENVDPADLEYSLSEYVDTDVLAGLGEMTGSVWEFRCRIADHRVRLTHDGRTYVDGVAYRGGVRIEEPSRD
jgi:hypothetical protein